jgi:hypothetical protein
MEQMETAYLATFPKSWTDRWWLRKSNRAAFSVLQTTKIPPLYGAGAVEPTYNADQP